MKNTSKLTMVIVILSVLLAVSVLLLGVVAVNFFKLNYGFVVVPGNEIEKPVSSRMMLSMGLPFIVTQEGAMELELNRGNSEDGTPFDVGNMFPGDRFEKVYNVKTSFRGNVTVRFKADVRVGSEKLAEVLKSRVIVEENGVKYLLYDGLMRDMPEYLGYNIYSETKTTAVLTYYISAYLDTSVGNEYQGKTLIADFRWWVPEAEVYIPFIPQSPMVPDDPDIPDTSDEHSKPDDPIVPDEPIEPDDPDAPLEPDDPVKPDDPGELVDPPGTSDTQIMIYVIIASVAVALILLLIFKRRKEDDSDE